MYTVNDFMGPRVEVGHERIRMTKRLALALANTYINNANSNTE